MNKKTIIAELISIADKCDDENMINYANEITVLASELMNTRFAWGEAEPPDSPPEPSDLDKFYESKQEEIDKWAVDYALNDAGNNFDPAYLSRVVMHIAQAKNIEPVGNPAEIMNTYQLQEEVGSYIQNDPSAVDYIINDTPFEEAKETVAHMHNDMINAGPPEPSLEE